MASPTEAEIQTQWRNAIDLIESTRNFADTDVAAAGTLIDTLEQSLEGDYTPALASITSSYRAAMSSLVNPGTALSMIAPMLFEYSRILSAALAGSFGGGYNSAGAIFSALYEYFHANSLTVQSRNITYDTTATVGGSNVGNGSMSRLTVDEYNYKLEACHVEKKIFRCRADANSGTERQAEVFEHLGQASSTDSLLRGSYGSGTSARTTIVSKHAGSGAGGSLAQNSSFSDYSATSTPKFTGWTETSGGSNIAQDTTNFYRSHPGASTNASLRINGGGGTVLLKQPISSMRVRRLDIYTPYFFRIMLNKTIGSALGGTVTIRMGSSTASISIASLGSGWQELRIASGTGCWFRNFNEEPVDIEIEWASSTSGYLLVDDAIFCPWDLIDGTFWCLRATAATHTPWLVDDTLEFTDTGGAPGTGKIQYWNWVSGLGYLPSTTGTPTFTDPV